MKQGILALVDNFEQPLGSTLPHFATSLALAGQLGTDYYPVDPSCIVDYFGNAGDLQNSGVHCFVT